MKRHWPWIRNTLGFLVIASWVVTCTGAVITGDDHTKARTKARIQACVDHPQCTVTSHELRLLHEEK